jgi:hypothetical protein
VRISIPVYVCPSRIKVNDSGTGSTYFRVVNKNGHPTLVLEVTFHISGHGLMNIFYFQWHRYKLCHFGHFSSNTDCHIATRASNGHFEGTQRTFLSCSSKGSQLPICCHSSLTPSFLFTLSFCILCATTHKASHSCYTCTLSF